MSDNGTTDRRPGPAWEDPAELATMMFAFARDGLTDALTAHLDAGVTPNLANHRGDTLVMLAAYHGHAATVTALLARGADPNVANDRGQTPLAGAVFKAAADVVAALVAGGADPSAGRPSALDTAALVGREDITRLLAAPDQRNSPA